MPCGRGVSPMRGDSLTGLASLPFRMPGNSLRNKSGARGMAVSLPSLPAEVGCHPTMGMNATLQNLLLDRIRPSPYQARQEFDERAIDDLARSIEKSGLSQPILVRPIAPDAEGPLYELVSGELRLRASRKLGRPRIWAIAEAMTDEEAALRGMLENIKRQDINLMERARGYKTLTEPPFNLTMEEVATRMGFKDNSTVSRIIDLLNQPTPIQSLLARASISERHVRYLNKIKDLRKRIRWANAISKKGWSVQDTE